MTHTATEIESIVRQVLERLRALPAAIAVGNESPKMLCLPESLITLETLRGRLSNVDTLQVKCDSVVTPAVRDELRQRGITLLRNDQEPSTPALSIAGNALASHAATVVLIGVGSDQLKQFGPSHVLPESNSSDATLEAVDHYVSQHLHNSSLAIWWTQQPFAATLAAAASRLWRPIQLFEYSDLHRALQESRPNMLVLDKRRWTLAGLRQVARRWQPATAKAEVNR